MHKIRPAGDKLHMSAVFQLADVDIGVVGFKKTPEQFGKALYDFLVEELAATGGQAKVCVDEKEVRIEWEVSLDDNQDSPTRALYISHLLQAGLLRNPLAEIAATAYSGNIKMLATTLLAINSLGLNRYMVEKDARCLALAAPASCEVWAALGLIMLDNGEVGEAAVMFDMSRQLNPLDYVGCKYGGIAATLTDPKLAVELLSHCVEGILATGRLPDHHLRASYGMALLAAGDKTEAGLQFTVVCGSKEPVMTPKQWVEGGYKIRKTDVAAALMGKISGA